MSWYTKGASKEAEDFKKSGNVRNLFRFWIKAKEKRNIMFLDDQAFAVWEHVVPLNGGYENYTCSRDASCPHCGNRRNATYCQYYTVLDLTPYTNKKGEEKKFSKKAFPAKGSAIDVLARRRQEQGGSLVGCIFEANRDTDKSPNCGNDFIFIKKGDITQVEKDIAKPYDFEAMLAPLPPHVIEAHMRYGRSEDALPRDKVTGAADAGTGEPSFTENDIPF